MTELSTDRRFHSLTQEQIQTLDQVLTEVIPIHGRGNFPTLEVRPKDIIHMVRSKLTEKEIKVRDVRLNGSTASHVLVKENGTSYKDLDIIFGVELPKQEDFQIIKEVVLSCLLDFLPRGVNKDKITALTMKEAYVQKMVKVFTEHDRWSLISLSNNSGKNVELKFVNSLRRQFEFSVDSFQIILDRMLESYLEAERRQCPERKRPEDRASASQRTSQPLTTPVELPSTSLGLDKPQSLDQDLLDRTDDVSSLGDSPCSSEKVEMQEEPPHLTEELVAEIVGMDEVTEMEVVTETSTPDPDPEPVSQEEVDLVVKNIEAEGNEPSLDKQTETSVLELQAQSNTLEAVISLSTVTQVHMENSTDTTEINADSMSPVEETTNEGQVNLKVLCVSPCQSCECLSQETQHTECPLPPPAKKTFANLQMVVLKHSSPKPPRKMSKKVTSMVPYPGKTSLPYEPPVVSQLLDPAIETSDESVPMEVDITDLNTNHCKLPTGTPQPEDCQVKLFDMQATTAIVELHENGTESQAEVTCSQNLSCELSSPSPEVTVQSVETEITQFNDEDQHNQIPTVEVVPPSPQALEPAVKIPDSTEQVPELATLAPESDAQEPENVTESTVEVLETASQVAGPTAQVAEASSEGPELLAQESTAQTSNIPELDTQSLESNVQLPEPDIQLLESDIQEPESNVLVLKSDVQVTEPDIQVLKSDIQVSEPDVQILDSNFQLSEPDTHVLESDVQVLKPVAQCEKLQMGATSHKQETEATALTRDLPTITVVAESMYGDFEQAMDHLRYRLIATRNPEEIRGGGLLKYSNLLVREFKPASETEIKTLERYMCSRFFIDFPDVNEQQRKIESYLRNHFIGEEKSKYDYLMTLRRVVNESTVCLMGHERRQTLNMITVLALKVLGEQNIIPNTTNVTCYYQPAPYMTDHSFNNYYMAHGQPPLFYQPYPLHIHMQTGLV